MTDKAQDTTAPQDDTTRPEPTATVVHPVKVVKKPKVRSAEQSAADHLLDQHRIGQFNQYPFRKHRYITVYTSRICEALVVLYVHFIKLNWDKFARVADKLCPQQGAGDAQITKLAQVYISHWLSDVYHNIRKSCMSVNPLAFVEKYSQENARYADRYDNYLSLLMNALKPTPIVGAIADEIYIPVLDSKMDPTKKTKAFGWDKYALDHTIFSYIHQTLELRKIVQMVPTSDDPIGRPSWLFDWFENDAYAWFPMEQNYKDIDIAVAYVLGVACTPKVSLPDVDEWRYFDVKVNLKNVDVNALPRLTQRKKYGTSECRLLEAEDIPLPDYYETDEAKFKKLNIGPLRILKKPADDDAETSGTFDDDEVPSSPRPITRSSASDAPTHGVRARIVDYIYHIQVISKADIATRFTAFKLFMAPPPQSSSH